MEKKTFENPFLMAFVVYLVISLVVIFIFIAKINRLEVFKTNYNAKIPNIFFAEYSYKLSDAKDILKHLVEDQNIDFSYLRGRAEEYFLNNTLTMSIAKEPDIFEEKDISRIMNERYGLVVKVRDFVRKINERIIVPKDRNLALQIKPDIEKIIFLLDALNEDLQSFRDSNTKKVYKEYEKELLEYFKKVEKKILQ
ncbi:hypothetical protein B0S90_0388 [Caldicellulosiruptor bescii]|uniref:Uncharacterized protein n=2 Tax=Caldicellulosiruptor bescii TaxID=31899 RepID=B9MLR9_CALBD|nr:hypothetical protein [Caldicellulosiruptor bescii]ACM59277.1 conserved hypothetical protein [Caldicellulosiruptor bescii DSM 6725]PBC88266.1 hypothetical protein B0S87_1237 [Caldicellulosiruptor bescii]PBC92253.1 hypothetical protein B0S89_2756 [Caldicellulosiruptor bescii]PBD04938.1 hypothetical protein B0S85_2652 [Caldicellulosiruptor bescii]PBD05432.1 hypothetical protein B0S90_0388 [Caldicellulosiruptor bescii]